MKFRKKPAIIEAEQYNRGRPAPDGVCRDESCWVVEGDHVHTLEGPLRVSHLDWIITGVKGEKYPCKPDIFEATYELVEEPTK